MNPSAGALCASRFRSCEINPKIIKKSAPPQQKNFPHGPHPCLPSVFFRVRFFVQAPKLQLRWRWLLRGKAAPSAPFGGSWSSYPARPPDKRLRQSFFLFRPRSFSFGFCGKGGASAFAFRLSAPQVAPSVLPRHWRRPVYLSRPGASAPLAPAPSRKCGLAPSPPFGAALGRVIRRPRRIKGSGKDFLFRPRSFSFGFCGKSAASAFAFRLSAPQAAPSVLPRHWGRPVYLSRPGASAPLALCNAH